jgi:hypothetical protein
LDRRDERVKYEWEEASEGASSEYYTNIVSWEPLLTCSQPLASFPGQSLRVLKNATGGVVLRWQSSSGLSTVHLRTLYLSNVCKMKWNPSQRL